MMRAAPAPVCEELLVRVGAREQGKFGYPEEVRVTRQRQFACGLREAGEQESQCDCAKQ